MDHRPGNGSLHRLFQVAVAIKGLDGVLEFIGGVLLLFVSPTALHRLVVVLTQHELAEEPDDWLVMVSVDEPGPLMTAGLKPPLVMPVGNGFSLPTLKFTVPVNPLTGVTVTVKAVDPPGTTSCAAGPTVIEKSGVVGSTVIVRVSGLGSELPLESMTVNET